MKIREVVRVDNKGRITIPLVIRDALDIREGMSLLLIADVDKKEILVTPISREAKLYEIEIEIEDRPGALAEVANELAKHGIDQVMTRCTTLRRGEIAECVIVVDTSKASVADEKDLEELIKRIEPIRVARIKPFHRG
ncbi:ACT domain-containing protein [Desulfurococcaceae archaeon MEX13E-LK6-19]|nr:ACT domain-containing protein [Desulfurococcaceae archaeon MEX13E-LK6-19]